MSDWVSRLEKAIAQSKFGLPPKGAKTAAELAKENGWSYRKAAQMLHDGWKMGMLDRRKCRRQESPMDAQPELFYFEKQTKK